MGPVHFLDLFVTIPQDSPVCIDLHCHSTASDGALSPSLLIARAQEQRVDYLALTDHDTIAGLSPAREALQGSDLTLINGVELSCVWRSHTIHVVGLDFIDTDPAFLAALEQQNENRWQRARMITERLHKLRVNDLLEKATTVAGGDVPGRPHFAEVLVNEGVVPRMEHAFKRYLGSGKPGDVKACWPELAEVVGWVRAAGGISVLAHPRKYRLTATRLRELVADFQRAGGQGIEVSVSGQSSGDLGFVAELARRQGLWASQGSDFHFPGAPWCELGRITKMPEGLEPVWHHFRQPIDA